MCVHVCVHERVCVHVCVCVWGGGGGFSCTMGIYGRGEEAFLIE